MLNFAILSAGNIAGRMARTLDSLRDEVQPYAIAARDSARAQALAGRYGFAKSFAGYEALLADPAVDVVYIGSIHPLHAQHIRAALLAGKHVLCEKPLTLNAAQAQSLFALARERGLLLAEAMWTRTLPFAQALRKTLADGRLGAPRETIRFDNTGTGFEPEVRAVAAALAAGRTECPALPAAETLRVLRAADALRALWGVRYPGEA